MKRAMRRCGLAAVAVLLGLMAGAAGRAEAGPVLSASGVSTDKGVFSAVFPIGSLINQSGLSSPYVGGVTDFDSYVAAATHTTATGTDWLSADLTATGNVDFDLGSAVGIDALAVWNSSMLGDFSVTSLRVLASTQADFSGATDLGTFGLPVPPILTPTLAQVLNFPATSARYIRLQILSNNGGSGSALGEVAFRGVDVSAVPEPSTLAMGCTAALLGLGYGWRKRRRTSGA